MHHFALVVALLTLNDILRADSALRKIDVSCFQSDQRSAISFSSTELCRRTLLLVDSEDDDDLVPAHTDELLDRSDTSPRELGEQNHSFDVVIFKLLGGG